MQILRSSIHPSLDINETATDTEATGTNPNKDLGPVRDEPSGKCIKGLLHAYIYQYFKTKYTVVFNSCFLCADANSEITFGGGTPSLGKSQMFLTR